MHDTGCGALGLRGLASTAPEHARDPAVPIPTYCKGGRQVELSLMEENNRRQSPLAFAEEYDTVPIPRHQNLDKIKTPLFSRVTTKCRAGFEMPKGDAFAQLGLHNDSCANALYPSSRKHTNLLATIKEADLSAQPSFFSKSSFLLEPFPKVGYQSLILNE